MGYKLQRSSLTTALRSRMKALGALPPLKLVFPSTQCPDYVTPVRRSSQRDPEPQICCIRYCLRLSCSHCWHCWQAACYSWGLEKHLPGAGKQEHSNVERAPQQHERRGEDHGFLLSHCHWQSSAVLCRFRQSNNNAKSKLHSSRQPWKEFRHDINDISWRLSIPIPLLAGWARSRNC